jgi:hypothetical protein
MAKRAKLIQELVDLSPRDWSAVIQAATRKRNAKLQREDPDERPRPGASRDEFAHWVARQHLFVDPGLSRIIYLPTNAPPEEIRLLEVNEWLPATNEQRVDLLDMSLDLPGLDFVVLASDITPDQWKAITSKRLRLPDGWDLRDAQEINGKGEHG